MPNNDNDGCLGCLGCLSLAVVGIWLLVLGVWGLKELWQMIF